MVLDECYRFTGDSERHSQKVGVIVTENEGEPSRTQGYRFWSEEQTLGEPCSGLGLPGHALWEYENSGQSILTQDLDFRKSLNTRNLLESGRPGGKYEFVIYSVLKRH